MYDLMQNCLLKALVILPFIVTAPPQFFYLIYIPPYFMGSKIDHISIIQILKALHVLGNPHNSPKKVQFYTCYYWIGVEVGCGLRLNRKLQAIVRSGLG